MISWLAHNLVTILLCLLLAAAVAAIIVKIVKDRKKGKTSCGCNCANCAMSGACRDLKK